MTRITPLGLLIATSTCITFVLLFSSFLVVLEQTEHPAQEHHAIMQFLNAPLFTYTELSFLTQDEYNHMVDVKRLLDSVFVLYLLALGLMLGILGTFIFKRMWEPLEELLAHSLWWAGWAGIACCLFLVPASLLGFEKLFVLFHAVFFPQGNWMFSVESVLITLYPAAFFLRFALAWFAYFGTASCIAVLLGLFMDRMRHEKRVFVQ